MMDDEIKPTAKKNNWKLSAIVNDLLKDWIKNYKDQEIYSKIMQEALENLRMETISNKDLKAIDVLENEDLKQKLIDEVSRIVNEKNNEKNKTKKKGSTIKKKSQSKKS